MSWVQYIQAAQQLGFDMATIINRENYQALAKTADNHIPIVQNQKDDNGNEIKVCEHPLFANSQYYPNAFIGE